MPRNLSDAAKQNKAAYDVKYMRDHVTQITIGFVDSNEEDQSIKSWLDRQGNKTRYIKNLIQDDMKRSGE